MATDTEQQEEPKGRSSRQAQSGDTVGMDGNASTPEETAAAEEAGSVDPEPEPEKPDPTAPIGRPAGRSSTGPEPQQSFNEKNLDIEGEEANLLINLMARDKNQKAHKLFVAADKAAKARIKELGYYDGRDHALRAGPFLVVLSESEGDVTHVSFDRKPSIRANITKDQ